jgi:hypothetical protein
MTDHAIDYDTLIAYALGHPAGLDTATIKRHLAGCAECRETVGLITGATAVIRADAAVSPSAQALDRVHSLGRELARTSAPGFLTTVKRVLAELTFDGRQSYAAAGLRGASDSYLLTYEQGDAVVDLELEPPAPETAQLWRMTGQLDTPDLAASVELVVIGGRAARAIAATDAHGVFSLAIESGNYDLLFSLDDRVIVVPGVEVG